MKDYLIKSKSLRDEASALLHSGGLHELFSSYGEVLYVGSYELDLMIWRDIDISIVVDRANMNDAVKGLVCALLDREDAGRVKVYRDLRKKYGKVMPDSDYIGLYIGKWKLDVHVMAKEAFESTGKDTSYFKSLLTSESRERILYWKDRLLTDAGRSPKFLGFHLKNAILKEKLSQDADIISYLKQNNISV